VKGGWLFSFMTFCYLRKIFLIYFKGNLAIKHEARGKNSIFGGHASQSILCEPAERLGRHDNSMTRRS
jgi:hypothetical protein